MNIGGICSNACQSVAGAVNASSQWLASTRIAQVVAAKAYPIFSAISLTAKNWGASFVSLHPMWQLTIGVGTVLVIASIVRSILSPPLSPADLSGTEAP